MFGLVGSSLAERVRVLFFRAVLYMEVAWFDQDLNSSGYLAARLASDAPAVRGAVGDTMGLIVQNVVTVVVGYTIAFVNGWKMTLVVLAVLPLLGFSAYVQTAVYTGVRSGLFLCCTCVSVSRPARFQASAERVAQGCCSSGVDFDGPRMRCSPRR